MIRINHIEKLINIITIKGCPGYHLRKYGQNLKTKCMETKQRAGDSKIAQYLKVRDAGIFASKVSALILLAFLLIAVASSGAADLRINKLRKQRGGGNYHG